MAKKSTSYVPRTYVLAIDGSINGISYKAGDVIADVACPDGLTVGNLTALLGSGQAIGLQEASKAAQDLAKQQEALAADKQALAAEQEALAADKQALAAEREALAADKEGAGQPPQTGGKK